MVVGPWNLASLFLSLFLVSVFFLLALWSPRLFASAASFFSFLCLCRRGFAFPYPFWPAIGGVVSMIGISSRPALGVHIGAGIPDFGGRSTGCRRRRPAPLAASARNPPETAATAVQTAAKATKATATATGTATATATAALASAITTATTATATTTAASTQWLVRSSETVPAQSRQQHFPRVDLVEQRYWPVCVSIPSAGAGPAWAPAWMNRPPTTISPRSSSSWPRSPLHLCPLLGFLCPRRSLSVAVYSSSLPCVLY